MPCGLGFDIVGISRPDGFGISVYPGGVFSDFFQYSGLSRDFPLHDLLPDFLTSGQTGSDLSVNMQRCLRVVVQGIRNGYGMERPVASDDYDPGFGTAGQNGMGNRDLRMFQYDYRQVFQRNCRFVFSLANDNPPAVIPEMCRIGNRKRTLNHGTGIGFQGDRLGVFHLGVRKVIFTFSHLIGVLRDLPIL